MKLRVHHLLCAPLYVGKGYRDKFTENMDEVVSDMKKGTVIELQTCPDIICSECPNQDREKKVCKLDSDKVKTKDESLLEVLSLHQNHEYDSVELMKYLKDNVTTEIFENSCSKCEWYLQGLCNYDKYIDGLKNFIQQEA